MAAECPLIGTWKLVSVEHRSPDGEVRNPYGPNPAGYIIYTPEGFMSVTIMGADRPSFASGDRLAGTREELAAAAERYMSYCGTYDYQGERVIHHVRVSLLPNWVGTAQVRAVQLDGNRLTLGTPTELQGGRSRAAKLVWERVREP